MVSQLGVFNMGKQPAKQQDKGGFGRDYRRYFVIAVIVLTMVAAAWGVYRYRQIPKPLAPEQESILLTGALIGVGLPAILAFVASGYQMY